MLPTEFQHKFMSVGFIERFQREGCKVADPPAPCWSLLQQLRSRLRQDEQRSPMHARCQELDEVQQRIIGPVQASLYDTLPARTCQYYSYWSGVPVEDMAFYVRDHCVILAWPTNQGLTLVGVNLPHEAFHAFRTDIEGNFLRTLEQVPQLAERVRAGWREERFKGTADLPFFFRQSHGAGWALVGDAGYAQDPIGGHGMSNAFRDAEFLMEAIDAGMGGNRPLATTLADYEQRRNKAARPVYEFVYKLAALEPFPPEMQHLFTALQGNQPAIDRLFGVLGGTVSFPEFFAPDNIKRIMAGAKIAA
jgi:2-polyprenyl-6-methoxyphenol hydroxylase-like FAD-dependent oxidoreductase